MKTIFGVTGAVIGSTVALFMATAPANADAGFRNWIKGFYPVAAKQGITAKTYNAVFAGVSSPNPDVIKSANYQPEFKSKIWDYMDNRITDSALEKGLEMKAKYANWLNLIEQKYGVNQHILLAIWSMETSYGAALTREGALRNVPRSLATLAYLDKRRAKFARSQLIAAMKIVQAGDVSAEGLQGSWAGAMGHTQFIPTSYLAWAQDIDGDGHRNVWGSVPDALASAANLLKKNGWRTGKTWGYEVVLPHNMNLSKHNGKTRTLSQWSQLGIRRASGSAFPRPADRAELKVLAGKNGPAFLMLRNFFVLKSYNNADKYALAVGHLADQLRGFGPLAVDWPRGYKRLDEAERKEMQTFLKRFGYYDGEIDGKVGPGSRKAIRNYQQARGVAVDGYASKRLLSLLRSG